MTDEELITFLRTSTSAAFNKTAADRIEALVKERDRYRDAFNTNCLVLRGTEERTARLEAALRKAEDDFYEAANRFQDEDYEGPHENFTVNVVCHVKPYFDMHMKHLRDSAEAARAAMKGADHE